jgi:electron transport complex protein RnfC
VLEQTRDPTEDGDRIIYGGPMTGAAIYSEDQPVMPDSDAIMVQDNRDIIMSGDDPCINCGECVRACPTNVPVNLLNPVSGSRTISGWCRPVRSLFLCGMRPVQFCLRLPHTHLQYIKLAKYELAREIPAEERGRE